MQQTPSTYYTQRMQLLDIETPENSINLLQYDAEAKGNVLKPFPVFSETEKGIEILVYTLGRLLIPIQKEGSRWKNKHYSITRLQQPIVKANGDTIKYLMPKGQGTHPFFPPPLVEMFESGKPFDTLYITEGYFKAFKGCKHGLPVVGVSSITHLKDKEKGTLHPDILRLINTCKIKRVVWLTDGDCLNLTTKEINELTDLYRRPQQFFQSANTFQQLLADVDVEKIFAHIDSTAITGEPKGLDDMLCAMPGKEAEVVDDLLLFGRPGKYAFKMDITFSSRKLRSYFHLDNVLDFYLFHVERRKDLKDKEFVWNGTRYKFDEEKNECKIVAPGEAKDYFRVGDQYHEYVKIPNKYGELEITFHRRMKGTIMEDYGKGIFPHIAKYKAFCNVPEHINFQRVIHSNFNIYAPFEHEPEEGEITEEDYKHTLKFIKHIFGEGKVTWHSPKSKDDREFYEYDLGLDYIQLLYQKPTQILPILCLVSRENNTGKSTFAKLLKQIFTANCAIVGNAELSDNFNASWASKLLVICDEAKIDKQIVVEKVKSLSTADKILMNAKGKDHVEIDFFGKFLFLTNNEENFIYASDEDVRYWVRKVPVIKDLNVDILKDMIDEIPAFLNYLNKRKMVTDCVHRAWFDPCLLKTEALKKVIAYSAPTIQKELRQFFRDKFFDFGIETLCMTRQAIHKDCFNMKYEANYLERVLKEDFKLDQYHRYEYDGKEFETLQLAQLHAVSQGRPEDDAMLKAVKRWSTHRHIYPRWEEKQVTGGGSARERVDVRDNGRHYIIPRSKFLSPEDIAGLHVDKEQQYITDNATNVVNQATEAAGEDLPF